MFDTITKVWSEVADEDNLDSSIQFSPTTINAASRRRATDHYIHHDRYSKNPLSRVRRTEVPLKRHGSPRILKPSNDNKKNTSSGLWNALGKIGKVFKGEDDSELKSMKNYMDGMITRRRGNQADEYLNEHRAAVRTRAESVSERALRFARENLSPQKKKQSAASPNPAKLTARSTIDKTVQPQMRRIHLKDLSEAESSCDSIVEKIRRRPLRSVLDTPRSTSLLHHDIPSSPFVNLTNTTLGNGGDGSEIRELSRKVSHLENTVESLISELRHSKERSQQLENSLRATADVLLKSEQISHHTILKSEDMDQIPEPKAMKPLETNCSIPVQLESEDEFEEVSRSLTPVKLDLRRFR